MKDKRIIMTIIDEQGEHEECYSAIIGIEIKGTSVILHIRENGDFSEEWWQNFPALLQNTIEQGLKNRRISISGRGVNDAKRNNRPACCEKTEAPAC